ncbi:phosphatase PAP2 family protein [Acinetobacter larvae]|uniref:Inositolphosphotransferase Aur1/Ipt1 domain-containing protein n=1 Tax=Acinetobacter larvae TaxID=1789224 RepID=A0A1B2LVG2_9GAMM|nr:phosphatase PAP2 family protein [Acinetobacter larvae]AOA56908.1 hypothetical protein BFG52_00040 [Acinetobacter larvae]
MNTYIARLFLAIVLLLLILAGIAISQVGQIKDQFSLIAVSILWLCSTWLAIKKPQHANLGVLLFLLSWAVFPLLSFIAQYILGWSADPLLLQIDQMLWQGHTLAAYFQYEQHPVWADVISACYFFFYLLIVASVIYYALQRKTQAGKSFFNGLITLYSIGFIGYLLFPAAGPAFTILPQHGGGGVISQWVTATVNQGVTGMDVFPSLHTAISIFIVGFLIQTGHRKIGIALIPIVTGTVFATIFLRYHYGVDILFGLALSAIQLKISQRQLQAPSSNGST